MPSLVIFFTGGNCFSHSIHKAEEVGPRSTNGSVMGTRGVSYGQKRGSALGIKGVGTRDAKCWFCN